MRRKQAHLLFICVEAHAFCNVLATFVTPDVERHFKPDDEDTLSGQFPSAIAQRMLALELRAEQWTACCREGQPGGAAECLDQSFLHTLLSEPCLSGSKPGG
jgi:hypothetical protein